ncbi:MAG: hypothetical protein ACOZBW_11335 [Thermodesulfobacteriota bacterium]
MAVLTTWLAGIGAGGAHAHRVMIFAWIDGDTVHTQSKFPGDRPVSGGEIAVCDTGGRVLFQGTTDPEGNFSFGLDRTAGTGALEIKLVAGMGHQASWTLTAEEIAAAGGGRIRTTTHQPAATSAPSPTPSRHKSPESSAVAGGPVMPPGTCLNETDVQRIVDAALERKLSPVMGMLVTIQEKMAVGLDDVMAGIGYIFGLAGVAAYAYSKGKKG